MFNTSKLLVIKLSLLKLKIEQKDKKKSQEVTQNINHKDKEMENTREKMRHGGPLRETTPAKVLEEENGREETLKEMKKFRFEGCHDPRFQRVIQHLENQQFRSARSLALFFKLTFLL